MEIDRKKILEIKDWSLIDYICIKSKSKKLYNDIYYLDGHPEYEKALTSSDRCFIDFARSVGIYGVSEKMIGESEKADRFYIRVNISNRKQELKLFNFFNEKRKFSFEQKRILNYLCDMGSVAKKDSDYRSLYYCGFSKKYQSVNFDSIRFYFKTFGVKETAENDSDYINYCEQCSEIRNDETFQIVKKIISTKKITLRCIGVDIEDVYSMKMKYYLSPIDKRTDIIELLWKLREYPQYGELINNLLRCVQEMSSLRCGLIQISSGDIKKGTSVNMYFENQIRTKKKYYSMRKGLILRDIGGVFFLIDIYEKHYYDLKTLFSVNETGKTIIEYVMNNGVCTLEGIVSNLRSLIKNYSADMYPVIYSDCKRFVERLKQSGYLQEVE